jgi:DNA polymerase I
MSFVSELLDVVDGGHPASAPLARMPCVTPPDDAPKRLFLLDGHSLAYRAFFALPSTLATSSGTVTNAVYGFTSMLIKLLGDEHPDLIAVAFDTGPPAIRLAMDAEYKAGRRETPADFKPQLELIEEVLGALRIPVIRVEGHEADDALGTLAVRASDRGIDAVIVTADRDFFQLVRDRDDGRGGIGVLYNRRGISEIDFMDEAAVEQRYTIPPAKYLDYVALKGDPSDNIPGVPGVGEKTAAKLVQEYGTVEALTERVGELKQGRLKDNLEASQERLTLNKQLARIVTDVELDVNPDDCVMGEWDMEEVRRLFVSLEFRSLLDRLQEAGGRTKPTVEVAELDLRQVGESELTSLAGRGPVAIQLHLEENRVRGAAASPGGAQAAYAALDGLGSLAGPLADAAVAKWTHDAKVLERAAIAEGGGVDGVTFDTLIAGYLLDPASADYPLRGLCERYLGTDVLGETGDEDAGQLFADEPWRTVAAEAAAVALLAPVMEERVDHEGFRPLLEDVELPLSSVLARMEARGVRLDVAYLEEMGESVRDRMATLQAEVFQHAGREFNLSSPPQLRQILYDELGLQPGKRTSKGALSTDATVLEKLRDRHPIVDALLSWRELDKLNSTYLEALPRMVDPRDGRLHTSFNQAAAATGRLSSSNPNLQNIPVRSEVGRQIRQAFVPGDAGQVLMVADYSQIELRVLAHLSGDDGLREAFASGADIHAATAAKVFGLPIEQVDPELRRRAKAVNYGLAYGMSAWGLASRLDLTADEAQEIMDGYFAGFPKIKEYLRAQVDRARMDGFTETILGRRRYIPELTSGNRRLQALGERQALNAPIQGSASDVFKVAMIEVERALSAKGNLECHMLLTVHDELVFEVPERLAEDAAGVVRQHMEHAIDLDVPLRADIGWGPNWADAVPAGH